MTDTLKSFSFTPIDQVRKHPQGKPDPMLGILRKHTNPRAYHRAIVGQDSDGAVMVIATLAKDGRRNLYLQLPGPASDYDVLVEARDAGASGKLVKAPEIVDSKDRAGVVVIRDNESATGIRVNHKASRRSLMVDLTKGPLGRRHQAFAALEKSQNSGASPLPVATSPPLTP